MIEIATIISSLKIVLIDLVMSGDNALIIAMATQGVSKKLKKKVMVIGVIGAAVLRILLASLAVYLLKYPIAQYIGGMLLLYVARGFFKTLKLGEGNTTTAVKNTFWGAVGVIVLADISLSLDNVLVVATIAENIRVLAGGLLVSVAMMLFASQLIAKVMDRHHRIQRGGLILIVHAALGILLESEIGLKVFGIPLGMIGLIMMTIIISRQYIKHIAPVSFSLRKHHLHNHIRLGGIFTVLFLFFMSDFLEPVHQLLHEHLAEWITLVFLAYMMILELVMQQQAIDTWYHKHESKH